MTKRLRPEMVDAAAIGQAIGDAIGFQVERQRPDACARHSASWLYGDRSSEPMRDGHATGQVSDDTQATLATLKAFAADGDQELALALELCATRNDMVGGGRTSLSMLSALTPLLEAERGLRDAIRKRDEAAPFQAASNGAVMRAWPYGFCADPGELVERATLSARITHRNPDSVSGAVATAAFTMAIAEVALEDPIRRAMEIASGDSNAVEMLRVAAALTDTPNEHAHRAAWILGGSDPEWVNVSPSPRATLAWAIRSVICGGADFRASVHGAIAVGGDVDTVAGLAGAWAGIVRGMRAIPAELAPIPNDRGRWGAPELRAAALAALS